MPELETPKLDKGTASPQGKPAKKEDNFFVFLIKLALIVIIFRSFMFSPFNIPSESMQPGLVDGDYLLAAKWPYGFSSYSLPFSVPLLPQHRIFATEPQRGDVVIFKAPANLDQDWIKRVIGLPGDTVEMVDGVVHLNGQAVPKVRIADFEVAVSPNTHCFAPTFEVSRPGGDVCHYPRFRETLPNGKSFNVLDLGTFSRDTTPAVVVPEGQIFVMGDNRDNSADSRVAVTEGGVGLLPQDNLVGRATIMMWSTDGSVVWYEPWTWLTATRWSRIGSLF